MAPSRVRIEIRWNLGFDGAIALISLRASNCCEWLSESSSKIAVLTYRVLNDGALITLTIAVLRSCRRCTYSRQTGATENAGVENFRGIFRRGRTPETQQTYCKA